MYSNTPLNLQLNQTASFINDGYFKTQRELQNERYSSYYLTNLSEGQNPAITAYAISQPGINFAAPRNASNGYNVAIENKLRVGAETSYRAADLDYNESIATYKTNPTAGPGILPNYYAEHRGGIDTRDYGNDSGTREQLSYKPMPKYEPTPLLEEKQNSIRRSAVQQANQDSGMHTRNVYNDEITQFQAEQRQRNASLLF